MFEGDGWVERGLGPGRKQALLKVKNMLELQKYIAYIYIIYDAVCMYTKKSINLTHNQ